MARVNRKAKKILITGMILGAAAGILLTFLAANSKMHDKNDEIKTVKAKYEKEAKSLKKHLPGVRRTEKKNEDRQKKQRQNRMILPEEVIIKYRVFLLQQRCRPRKVKCQRRQQRKSVKRILQEKIRICGN